MMTDHLHDAAIAEMRRLHTEEKMGYNQLAKVFGVNETTARNIVLGRIRNADGAYPMKPWAETSGKFGQGPT